MRSERGTPVSTLLARQSACVLERESGQAIVIMLNCRVGKRSVVRSRVKWSMVTDAPTRKDFDVEQCINVLCGRKTRHVSMIAL
jgi:hypothetical protein